MESLLGDLKAVGVPNHTTLVVNLYGVCFLYSPALKQGAILPETGIPHPLCKNDQWDSLHDEQ
jgi:hypothetical protein